MPDGPTAGLYFGGGFRYDGDDAGGIAVWDGVSLGPVGGGVVPQFVGGLALGPGGVWGSAVYAGGSFTMAGDVAAVGVARWDGKTWSSLGPGSEITGVRELVFFDDGSGDGPALYAAGTFTEAGGQPANRIAKWDGTAWSALGSGAGGDGGASGLAVLELAVYDDGSGDGPALYAAGRFSEAGGIPALNIAKWDGTAWQSVGGGLGPVGGSVEALAVHDDGGGDGPALYATGNLRFAGGEPVRRIARWDGTSWTALGDGLGHPMIFSPPWIGGLVLATGRLGETGGPSLFVGGDFRSVGDQSAGRVAEWRGCGGTPCAVDLNGDGAVTSDDFFMFLGGFFSGGAGADYNGDGVVNNDDYFAFVGDFFAGC